MKADIIFIFYLNFFVFWLELISSNIYPTLFKIYAKTKNETMANIMHDNFSYGVLGVKSPYPINFIKLNDLIFYYMT
jgi:hypothetical protein